MCESAGKEKAVGFVDEVFKKLVRCFAEELKQKRDCEH